MNLYDVYSGIVGFYTMWAVIGVLLGTYALISVWRRWRTINEIAKALWWFQVALTPLSGLFVLWTTFGFRGLVVQLAWQPALVLIAGGLLALMNALGLLVEASAIRSSAPQLLGSST